MLRQYQGSRHATSGFFEVSGHNLEISVWISWKGVWISIRFSSFLLLIMHCRNYKRLREFENTNLKAKLKRRL
jgi:hypothetical protein